MLLVHLGTAEDGQEFFATRWPEARAAADTDQVLYRDFGLGKGGFSQLFGPRVFLSGFRAALRGHGVGRPVGSPWIMSGWFLVHGGAVRWEHRHEHAGAERQFDAVARAHRELLAASAG